MLKTKRNTARNDELVEDHMFKKGVAFLIFGVVSGGVEILSHNGVDTHVSLSMVLEKNAALAGLVAGSALVLLAMLDNFDLLGGRRWPGRKKEDEGQK